MDKDLRVRKTKKAILNVFTEELINTNFEDVTITSICDKAEIRRATFYNHFQDKYELLAYAVRNTVKDFTKDYGDIGYTYETLLLKFAEDAIDFLTNNTELVLSLSKSNLLPLLNSIMFEEVRRELEDCYEKYQLDQSKEIKDKKNMLVHYHFEGIFGALKWWTNEKEPITKEELSNEILTIIRDGFK